MSWCWMGGDSRRKRRRYWGGIAMHLMELSDIQGLYPPHSWSLVMIRYCGLYVNHTGRYHPQTVRRTLEKEINVRSFV